MPKQYRALIGFRCPADPESLKKARQVLKLEDGEKRDALIAEIKWMEVKEGDKLVPYNDEIIGSWLANDAVEEVKSHG